MKCRKIIGAALSAALVVSSFAGFSTAFAAAKTPQYQKTAREMEKLNRGLIAVKTEKDTRDQTVNGVVLSWRLLGDESLENQAFDIYRDDKLIKTTGAHDATYFVDTAGTASNKYKVVKAGSPEAVVAAEQPVTPTTQFSYAKPNEVGNGNSYKHSFTYVDIPISMPTDIKHANTTALSDYKRNSNGAGGANDASVGDLDGDGDYEIVLKWDPVDSRDAAGTTTTGDCILDAYEIDPNNDGYMWRIDLGQNITSGAHSTQFMVYDFDGDGKAEIACQTAEGSYSIDSSGEKHYVTEVGDSEAIRNGDNNATHLSKGKNIGADYLTIFDGETGRPLRTTAGIPLGSANGADWGDSKLNRSSRYLAAVAYLDGVHPSFIAIRGMYNKTVIRAYNWDGEDFTMLWEHNGNTKGSTMYGQGNHNLNIADIDEDGKDEIVYGSACLDDDGKTVLGNTLLGHGDAMHTSDFNNDGVQEVFSVKEDKEGFSRGEDFRVAKTGKAIWSKSVTSDNGRGVMGNIDDAYASTHPNALALGWDAAHAEAFDFTGTAVGAKPSSAGKGDFCNFLVYWDGDLSSELLDANIIQKYDAANGWTKRFYGPNDGYTLSGQTNNDSKRNYSLVADLWGDWREEIIMPVNDSSPDAPALRIFTSIVPTEYRLTTLMHDCQYREAIAWQNVGYNQPPHTSYYIGSAALATDASGKTLNYLAPAVPYTKVEYPGSASDIPVTGLTLSQKTIELEKGSSYTLEAKIQPENADKKSVTWISSEPTVATVTNGIVKAVGDGTAIITATAKDTTLGTFSDTCTVNVHSTPVTGLNFPGYDNITIMNGATVNLEASVIPETATDKKINWSSTNENVVTVDENGAVTGVGDGSAIIRAVTDDGGFTGEKIVTVAGQITDKTGTDKFTATGADAQTKISTSETSVSVEQKEAANGMSAQRDFEVLTENKAILSFAMSTGGQKINNGGWGWSGHEYNLGFKLLDESGNNILTVSQDYTSSAQATKYAVGDEDAINISGDWKEVSSGSNSPLGRSSARWYTTVEFDYDNNSCTVSIKNDPDDSGNVNEYAKTFDLNDAHFKTLQLYTAKAGSGTITVSPSIGSVSYSQSVPTDGVGSKLYDKATYDKNKWTEADLNDWTQNGAEKLELDAANNRIWYHPTKPSASYSATKTFDVADNSLVTYDIDWYFANSMGDKRDHADYLKLGSKIMFGWKSDYGVHVSKDGGATWEEAVVFSGKEGGPKNVHLVYDNATKTVKSLKFDNKDVAGFAGLTLDEKIDSVTFGLNRIEGASTSAWEYPGGIDSITVIQFTEGAEQPSTPVPVITPEPTNTPEPTEDPNKTPEPTNEPDNTPEPTGEPTDTPEPTDAPTPPPTPDPANSLFEITDKTDAGVTYHISTDVELKDITVYAALYDGEVLKAVKLDKVGDVIGEKTGVIDFDEPLAGYTVKLFAWNGNLWPAFAPALDTDEATE